MSAPPGYDGGSILPDPGRTIPITAQSGGMRQPQGEIIQTGGEYSKKDLETLTAYGLQKGGIIDQLDEEVKRAFLKQHESGGCSVGDSAILKKDCWAVVAVIDALIKYDMSKCKQYLSPSNKGENIGGVELGPSSTTNSETSSSLLPGKPASTTLAESSGLGPTTANNLLPENISEESAVENVPTEPNTNPSLKINMTKGNKSFYSNLKVGNKSMRIYGKNPDAIKKRYNWESRTKKGGWVTRKRRYK